MTEWLEFSEALEIWDGFSIHSEKFVTLSLKQKQFYTVHSEYTTKHWLMFRNK